MHLQAGILQRFLGKRNCRLNLISFSSRAEKDEEKPEWADAAEKKKEFVKEQLEALDKAKGKNSLLSLFIARHHQVTSKCLHFQVDL